MICAAGDTVYPRCGQSCRICMQRSWDCFQISFGRMAEEVGFEPTGRFRPSVFRTAALNHSATPPFEVTICDFKICSAPESVAPFYRTKMADCPARPEERTAKRLLANFSACNLSASTGKPLRSIAGWPRVTLDARSLPSFAVSNARLAIPPSRRPGANSVQQMTSRAILRLNSPTYLFASAHVFGMRNSF